MIPFVPWNTLNTFDRDLGNISWQKYEAWCIFVIVNYLACTGWMCKVEVKYFCWNWIIDNDNKKSDRFFFKMFRRSFDSK